MYGGPVLTDFTNEGGRYRDAPRCACGRSVNVRAWTTHGTIASSRDATCAL